MSLSTIASVICIFGALAVTAAPLKMKDSAIMHYLAKYGYMEEGNFSINARVVVRAITDFQAFMGMQQTGTMDAATHELMLKPRCGMRDKYEHFMKAESYKQGEVPGRRWPVKQLSYRISKYTEDLTPKKIEKTLTDAFKLWSDVTDLTFTSKRSGKVDIDISFDEGLHGDGFMNRFDGESGVLAHAWFPTDGDTHFDDAELWTEKGETGISLLSVGAHEFGHALGLDHSSEEGSMMYPSYSRRNIIHKLHKDDIARIQELYGAKKTGSKPTPPTHSNELCNDASIDAALTMDNGKTIVFKGDKYYELASNMIADGYPQSISSGWPGLPGQIDAAFHYSPRNHTYFFKGSQFWRYEGNMLKSGYPKKISVGFPGIPDNVDLSFKWTGNNKIYFFKGSSYWRYIINEPMPDTYPKSISNWRGLPNNLNAAMRYKFAGRMQTYFFKGGQYYKYNDITNQVDESVLPFPRSSGKYWFGCS